MNDNILIVGTGALASLFAARLTQAGHAITMLGTWQAGLDAINQHGIRLLDAAGNEQQFKVSATNDPRECVGAQYAIVLVKAWQTERAAHQLQTCLADDGLALTLQNGLGNYKALAQILDHKTSEVYFASSQLEHLTKDFRSLSHSRVALGSTTTGATLLGPGLVKAGGEGTISIGRHPALGPLEAALRSTDLAVQVVDDPQSLIWGKLVINAAINPLTALLKIPNGELLQRPSARTLMHALAQEAAEVARAENITLPFVDPVAAVEAVTLKTAANHSSMLQDVLRGAPTEIDAICGAIVNVAEKHHMRVPANWICWQLVKAL